ncbi:MAG: hypothetical protein GX653_06270, partial [Clostridiales bacterium]|nr:hypothetical protein [Clostridiales bacterium]
MTLVWTIFLQSSAFIVLLAALRPLLKHTLSARARHALWGLPALRLMLPVAPGSALSLWNLLTRPRPAMTAVPVRPPVPMATSPAGQAAAVVTQPVTNTTTHIPAPIAPAGPDWAALLPRLLCWVWVAGVLIALGWLIYTNLRFRRHVRHSGRKLFTDSLPLPVWLVEDLPSPCLTGVLRPRILINRAALRSEDMLDMVLLHELTHWKRLDHLWALLRAALLCAWWWHPLAWLAAAYSRLDAEAACDERVIRDMTLDQRQGYGLSLIELMRTTSPRGPRPGIGTAMSAGKRHMKERIAMIANHKRKNRIIALCCALGILLLAPLVMTSAQQPATPPAATSATADTKDTLTDERAIELAKQAVMSYIVYDEGINRFDNPSVQQGLVYMGDGQERPMVVVTLTAVNPHVNEVLHVSIDPQTHEPMRIDGRSTLWEADDWHLLNAQQVGKPGIIRNQRSDTLWVSLCSNADDYGWAKELLYNGTPVMVDYIIPTRGAYSHDLFDDDRELWAHVTVGQTEQFEGTRGYVPLVCLDMEATGPAQGEALYGKLEDGGIVYADTGLTQNAIATPGEGAQVRVLGRTSRYYHVQSGDSVGFVPLAGLAFDDATRDHLRAQVPDGYEEVQPGWESRRAEYEMKRGAQYNQYGPVEQWTLAQKAEGSALAQEYGFEWLLDRDMMPIINVLPGPDDLTEQQAYQAALAAAMDKYGFEEKRVKKHGISLYHRQDTPDARVWHVRFWLAAGLRDCSVRLNAKGEPIEYWQDTTVNRAADPDEGNPETLTYYLASGRRADPGPEDMAEQAAVDKAMAIFRANYLPAAYRPYRNEASFLTDEESGRKWWLVNFHDEDGMLGATPFQVVLLAPDGSRTFHTRGYEEIVQDIVMLGDLSALEREKGPFFTWSLEDQAAYYPSNFSLPG